MVNLSRTRIKYVEIGFRNFKQNRQLGATGYTEDKLLNKLQIPSNLKIGVMVNASELKNITIYPPKSKKTFSRISKKLSFVRFACHFDEVFLLRDCIYWLQKKKLMYL